MNWPLFTHPALLGGLAAVAIPVLIHLLLKTRKQRLRFSTLRFFQRPNEEAKRRRKLRHWLLLAGRMLMIALLALGFARPYLANPDATQASQPRRQVILVVDRSASMGAMDREGVRWDRAKAALRKLLLGLRPEDRASLISCSARAETLLGPATPADILRLLNDLQPTQSGTELGEGLQLAAKMVSNSGARNTNTIYIVSDLQRTSCQKVSAYPIPLEADLQVLNFGDVLTPNSAVTELILENHASTKPSVTLANFSDEDAAPVTMQFRIDNAAVATTAIALPSGGSTNLELTLPRLSPGWHSGVARLQAKDGLALDDARYQTIYAPPPMRVLVVEPRQATKLFLEESFFVVSALDPAFGTTNQYEGLFAVEKTTPDALGQKLGLREGKPPYAVTILPALKQIPAGLGVTLAAYLQAGGDILVFLGDTMSANRYFSEFGEWLPAQVGALESANELDWRLWEKDAQSPVFAAFRQPNSGNLSLAKFTRRCALKASGEGAVLAWFQDGAPLLVSRQVGQGKVLLVNTTADTAWTDWPKHRTFVPWLHGAVQYLGGGLSEAKSPSDLAFLPDTETDLAVGPAWKKAPIKLQTPEGREIAGTTDETGTLRNTLLATCGIYSLRSADGREIRRLAVNPPVAESDLTAMTATEFIQRVTRLETPPDHSLAASLFGSAPDHRELWRLCLLAVFALLFLELSLANRTTA